MRFAAILVTLMIVSTAAAQDATYGIAVSAEGFFGTEGMFEVMDLGGGLRVGAIYGTDPTLMVDVSFGASFWHDGDETVSLQGSGASLSYRVVDLTVALRYMFLGAKRGFEPFLTAGMGYHRAYREVSGGSPLSDARINKYGLIVGLGFSTPLSEHLYLEGATKVHYAPNFVQRWDAAHEEVIEGSGIFGCVGVGFSYRFGSREWE